MSATKFVKQLDAELDSSDVISPSGSQQIQPVAKNIFKDIQTTVAKKKHVEEEGQEDAETEAEAEVETKTAPI